MEQFNLIPPLARARPPISQILWGLTIASLFISLQTLLWKWMAPTPYVLLPMAVVLASFFGGGLIAGFTATLSLVAYSFRFPESHQVIPQVIFFGSGILETFLVSAVQKKIRELVGAEVRAEEAERLKFAAASAKLGIWEWDIQKDILTWDEQMLHFYGIDRKSFTGTVASWKRGLHPDDVAKAMEATSEALSGKKLFDHEFRVVHPDGTVRTLKGNGLVFHDKNGKPEKMFGLNRDITEEKRNLDEIQELKAYFEAALVQSQTGIVIADAPSGLLRFVNPAALQISGGDESNLVRGVDINRYARWRITDMEGVPIANDDLPLARAVRFGETSSQKVIFVRPNGEKRVGLCQTGPIRRADGSIMSGITIFVDITEQHRLLEELNSARETAEIAMRAKSKFLDIAAHELRTPVTAASLLAELVQRQMAKGTPPDAQTLQRIRAQLERLSRLVIDLLEVSKLDRGVLELRREFTDLSVLISDCKNNFMMQFPNREIRFTAPAEPVKMIADPIRLYEVISNLLDNALKYSPENSPVELQLEDEPTLVRFSVRDHGPGLGQDTQRKLFLAFERANTDARASGLGLGLFICRGIVNLHGGNIGVKSKLGSGSTFYFELPKKQPMRKTGS